MSTKAQQVGRVDAVDVLRGIAVVFMLWMHTADGWLKPGYRQAELWHLVRTFGGMAAPLFLLLAGVSLGLVWQGRGGQVRLGRELPRALQVLVLGYALRLQMWVVDGGGVSLPSAWLPLLGGYLGLWLAAGRAARGGGARWGAAALACAALCGLGLLRVAAVAPGRLDGLLRVDILQTIGAALALTSLVGRACPERLRLGALWAAAAAVALSTHAMRQWVPGPLPGGVAGYLAYWRDGPGMVMALFPLFPWASYTLAGAAVGVLVGRAAARGQASELLLRLAPLGALVAVLTAETAPLGHAVVAENPWLAQPIRVAYRLGVGLAYGAVAVAMAARPSPLRRPLASLGRASLLVYWVHLQFAFGLASRPLAHRLDPAAWLAWLALLALAMWALSRATEGLRLGRGGPGPEPPGGGITKARMGLVT